MAIKTIVRMGDPLLLKQADPVKNFGTPELLQLIADMKDTMASENGAGIAAPQVGISLQLVIFGGFKSSRYPDEDLVPFTILCNPIITPVGNDMTEGWEGCLSVPGMRGLVPRYEHIRYQGYDEQGLMIDRTVSGFHARVVQHECDHLFGMLYPMRIRDLRNFGFQDVMFPANDADTAR